MKYSWMKQLTSCIHPYITSSTVILTAPPLKILALNLVVVSHVHYNFGSILNVHRESKTSPSNNTPFPLKANSSTNSFK